LFIPNAIIISRGIRNASKFAGFCLCRVISLFGPDFGSTACCTATRSQSGSAGCAKTDGRTSH